ncbi:MAG: Eco57I restriction-modification methylase domain-containing protein [Nitrospira sp.]|nr:Eco57I restriction-modification methylase domain-containing protein [Nitrospira sp.]
MVEVNGKTFENLRERQIGQRLRKILRALGEINEPGLQGALHLAWVPLHEGGKLVAIEFATLRLSASGKASEDILFRHRVELIEGQPSRTPLGRLDGFAKALLAHQDRRSLGASGDLDPSFLELRKASSGAKATLTPGTTDFLRATLAALFDVQALNDAFFQELNLRFRKDLLLPLLKQGKVAKMPAEEVRGLALNLLMRLLFLRFLEAKGWIHADEHWMLKQDLKGVTDAYADILAPVFESLATPKEQRRKGLPDLPYLNGGLFDPDTLGLGGLTFDPDCFNAFRSFLYQHAFTLEESTPLDQRVAIDPEMLGRVFETLVLVMEEAESTGADLEDALEQGLGKGKTRRKVTGSYYTPRVIVQYLCRETLDAHLMQATGRPKSFFDALRARALDAAHEEPRNLRATEIKPIEEELGRLRVCDPAVGSGAFLVGMMQEILLLRTGLARCRGVHVDGTGTQAAEWKREAITQCLYGVDLNPEAVEICRLRLWLSLVIDAEGDEPLPSLDFRIVCGDSLVDRLGEESFPDSIGGELKRAWAMRTGRVEDAHREAEASKDLKAKFAREEDPVARRNLRTEILAHSQKAHSAELQAVEEDLEGRLRALGDKAKWATAREAKHLAKATDQLQKEMAWIKACLSQLTKDGYLKKPFFWKLAFPEVFDSGGFDIVVGNPPYVRQENLDAIDQNTFQHAFKEVFSGTADLYAFFFQRSHQLLKHQGQLGFITSNGFTKRDWGVNLSKFLATQFEIHHAIDFGELKVFEATVEPYVVVMTKKEPAADHRFKGHFIFCQVVNRIPTRRAKFGTLSEVRLVLEEQMADILEHERVELPQSRLTTNGWRLGEPEVLDLYAKLLALPGAKPLGDFAAGRMYYGIKTGLNEAFVIDEATKNDLIRQDKASKDLIKPWLRGKDVKRWKPAWAGKYVIAVQNSGDADCDQPWSRLDAGQEKAAEAKFKQAYPAIWAHMKAHEAKLRPRADQGKFWWELRACAYYEAFSKPKIVWPSINRTIRFAWDADGTHVNDKCNMIVGHPEWLLGVLNSELLTFLYCMLTSQIRGSFMELKTSYISPVPIVDPSKYDQSELTGLVRSLRTADPEAVPALEARLNDLVYRIYGLSAAERALIEGWFQRRCLKGGAEEDDDDEADEA